MLETWTSRWIRVDAAALAALTLWAVSATHSSWIGFSVMFLLPDLRGTSSSLTRKAAVPPRALRTSSKICRTMSISGRLVRRPNETPNEAGSNKEADDARYGVRESH